MLLSHQFTQMIATIYSLCETEKCYDEMVFTNVPTNTVQVSLLYLTIFRHLTHLMTSSINSRKKLNPKGSYDNNWVL